MHQEPCGSETTTSGYSCASDGRLVWTSDSAEQAVNTPNDDEEMLEQMSHPKNKVMERMTPLERWNGLAWVWTAMERSCSLWRRREFWDHSVPPNTTRSTRLSLCGCDLTTSISSTGMQGQANGPLGESAQTEDLPRQPSKKYSTRSRCFAPRSSRARGHLKRMDTEGLVTDGLEELGFSPKKSHQRSQSTGCVLVRKAPTKPVGHQHHRTKVDSDGASSRDRVLMSSPLDQAVR